MDVNELKKRIVIAAYRAGEGHIASAFSILDILYVLHTQILGPDDRFILSKGHASLAYYAALGLAFDDFCGYDSLFGGHPDRNKVPGVLASTGSLGHGFPIAVGVALARKIKGSPGRIYCLVGDGECNEGSIWEASLLAAHHKLDNLCLIVDHNHSNDRAIDLGNLTNKFSAFDFVVTRGSGHDHRNILNALLRLTTKQPVSFVAETIKGYGCQRMENNPEWHHRVPTAVELSEILEELNAQAVC